MLIDGSHLGQGRLLKPVARHRGKLSSVQHLSERARAPVYTQRKATPEEVAHDSEEDDSDQHSDENDFDQHSDDQQSDDEPDNADGFAQLSMRDS